MEYNDYDLLLKYNLFLERQKSTYLGDPSLYNDGRTLETFPELGDKVNGKEPLFVFGTVVYLHYKDKFLILKQNKDDRIVDTLVGLGGKVRPIIGHTIQNYEKNKIEKIHLAYQSGELGVAEDIRLAAAREVAEETSTYKKDANGHYTHEIEQAGLYIDPKQLNEIGISRIRIIQSQKTECWLIYNFMYELSNLQYNFILESVSKENREGTLEWMTLEELLPYMSNADRIILENHEKKISVSEIRDCVNGHNITRVSFGNDFIETYINNQIIYSSSNNVFR